MPRSPYGLPLAIVFATSACAEIEFGVPAGGASTGGAGAGEPLGGGGGSPPLGEQCLNGTDDDDDGLADCADDDCPDVSCVDIPPGWLGPVELRDDDSACEGAFSVGIASLKNKVEAEPASCNCTCTGVPASCDGALVTFFALPGCLSEVSIVELENDLCASLSNAAGAEAYVVEPNLVPGACTSGVDSKLPPASFEARRLCGLPAESAGCDDGSCAPSATCVYMPGNVVCPNGFGTPFMGNAGLIDSRGCEEAGCGCTASGTPCSYVLELFDNQNCQGGVVGSTVSTACSNISFQGGGDKGALFTASAGSTECGSTGIATPTGSVTVSEPMTVCCAL
jgi:hypothetical protein